MSIVLPASIAAWPTPSGSPKPLRPCARSRSRGRPTSRSSAAASPASRLRSRLHGLGKRVRLHEARAVASGASGRNGGFALRGGAMAYDSAREWLGHDAAADYWRLTEAYVDRMVELGGDAVRRTGSLRLAGDDERDELQAEYEALREDGFAAEWRDELPEPLAGRFPGALFHPDDAVLQPARLVRRLALAAAEAGVEIREHDRVEDLGAARGRDRPRRHRRLPERPARGARRADHPDARADDRDGAASRAPVPDAALRPARLRLLAPERGGPADRRRLPGRGHGLGVHRGGGDDGADPRGAGRLRRGVARRTADGRAPLGGRVRARPRPDAGRRPPSRFRTASGSPVATPDTATCSG